MIQELTEIKDLQQCASVIRESFATVAKEFGLTRDNAPTNPAFIEAAAVIRSYEKGIRYFGLYQNDQIIGCIAVEKSGDHQGTYYLERLAVLPDYRHKGLGKTLLDHALSYIKSEKGARVSIGIINENAVLKKWYQDYGFHETSVREFDHLSFFVCFMELAV